MVFAYWKSFQNPDAAWGVSCQLACLTETPWTAAMSWPHAPGWDYENRLRMLSATEIADCLWPLESWFGDIVWHICPKWIRPLMCFSPMFMLTSSVSTLPATQINYKISAAPHRYIRHLKGWDISPHKKWEDLHIWLCFLLPSTCYFRPESLQLLEFPLLSQLHKRAKETLKVNSIQKKMLGSRQVYMLPVSLKAVSSSHPPAGNLLRNDGERVLDGCYVSYVMICWVT